MATSAATLQLDVGAATDVGRQRSSNEDSMLVLLPPDLCPGPTGLLVVADGMGGHQAGEVASRFVVQGFREMFQSGEELRSVSVSPAHPDFWLVALKEAIERIHEAVLRYAAGRPDWRGMGSTVTAALVVGDRLFVGHLGDTRAYLVRTGEAHQLTQDHTLVAEQVRIGVLTPEEAAVHPQRNVLTQAVGAESQVVVERTCWQLLNGDVLVLCSDGLSGLVRPEEIAAVVHHYRNVQAASATLVALANQRGGPDNITAVVARAREGGRAGTPTLRLRHRRRRQTRPSAASLAVALGVLVLVVGAYAMSPKIQGVLDVVRNILRIS
ncbi:MAG: Stp1/IreP family PP2C-type Ser/Thr phosphatase [Chloroflexi bacterium]|nr:Stp1/IreP family PP2C-type Ser/Thr phosphatase [Chloroflexota bacterium]